MRDSWAAFRAERGLELDLRIGLHTGPLIAGVIGQTDRSGVTPASSTSRTTESIACGV